ncbi:hypothetical protein PHPALM_6974 [Phytophthora palmivora]|uniref:Uncharacterized protein n=1 Tax=Phytophthora palmivora TaxID=4796 RepID=A0A2P4YDI2_9STRA|nr:hypothetical protein PHPALM_6974 [Phytophthora palmivora]
MVERRETRSEKAAFAANIAVAHADDRARLLQEHRAFLEGRDDASMKGDDATEEEEDVDEDVEGDSAEEEDAEDISAKAGETEGASSEVEGAWTHAESEREQEG